MRVHPGGSLLIFGAGRGAGVPAGLTQIDVRDADIWQLLIQLFQNLRFKHLQLLHPDRMVNLNLENVVFSGAMVWPALRSAHQRVCPQISQA